MTSQAAQPRIELKVARIRKGLNSQQKAAEAMGLERRIVWRAESGHGISLESALKMAAFYGQPVEELFGTDLERVA